MRFCQRSLFRN